MELPRKWPGRAKVRQALTLMRVIGCWDRDIQAYASSPKRLQKLRYLWFRETYYWEMFHKHPEFPTVIRIGR